MSEPARGALGLKGRRNDMPSVVLRSTLGYLEREAARRDAGEAARIIRFHDDELRHLVEVLRREIGTAVPDHHASDGVGR